jgi:plasmid maintenance system killer protein
VSGAMASTSVFSDLDSGSRSSQGFHSREHLREPIEMSFQISLASPPANHLEKLTGNRARQYSIREDNQFRVCFRCKAGDAFDVEITDYH